MTKPIRREDTAGRTTLEDEIRQRVSSVRVRMMDEGLTALVVYGDVALSGNLRYLTDFVVDRCGWLPASSQSAQGQLFEAAAVVIPAEGPTTLTLESGLMFDRSVIVDQAFADGLAGVSEPPTLGESIAKALADIDGGEIGIETWDRFPMRDYQILRSLRPKTKLSRSTIVQELRLVKSAYELQQLRDGAAVGDRAHAAVCRALRERPEISELELIRIAEGILRDGDPEYEDAVTSSPSKICSGSRIGAELLHTPLADKAIRPDDVVNWDICGRFRGYSIDTSRTRMVAPPSEELERAQQASIRMFDSVIDALRPGALPEELVKLADEVAQDEGFELWGGFLGHATGLECQEQPVLTRGTTPLQENMVFAIEPRVVVDGTYLIASEDIVRVTSNGGEVFGRFPRDQLQV